MFKFSKKGICICIVAMCIASFIVYFLTSCNGNINTSGEDSSANSDTVINLPSTDDRSKPKKGIIIFDGSSSMKGYVDATTAGNFQTVIGKLNNMGETTESYTFDTIKTPIKDFLSKIQNKNIKWANESDLFAMIQEIMMRGAAEPSNVYMLITDGIISGSNKEIKADPSYNVSKPSLLSSRIEKIISSLPKESEISLLVAKWDTPFNGTYYEYDNNKRVLRNESRPFYVVVVGNKDMVAYANSILNTVDGIQSVEYGTTYSISVKLTNGIFKGKNHYKQDADMKSEGITAELNLKSLPAYARNLNYLKKNLEIVKTIGKEKKNTRILSHEENGDYELTLDGTTLSVKFAENIKNQLPASFEFRIKRSQPQWVMDAVTHDDKMGYSPTKTFNLDYFLNPFLKLNDKNMLNDSDKSIIEITK